MPSVLVNDVALVPPLAITTGTVNATVPVVVIGLGVSVIPVPSEMDVTVPDPGPEEIINLES
jgi:hypothetical protein